jgi:transposase InsO family protein
MRLAVTHLLRTTRLPRGDRSWLAWLAGCSTRTLSTWGRRDVSDLGPGRPGHAVSVRWHALRQVARQRRTQGQRAGWRPLAAALPDVPMRLVQALLPRLKARSVARREAHLVRQRVHVEILKRDVLFSQDTTHVGLAKGRRLWSEVVEDVGTMKTLAAPLRPAATRARDVIAQLEALEHEERLPLVWATDNGSAYTAHEVQRWLAAHEVVHLRSLPHTPQHNAWVERRHGELKSESGLGRGVLLASVAEATSRWDAAREVLDAHRLRSRLQCRTAAEIDGSLPSWEGAVDRRTFHEAVRRARELAVLDTYSARARRRAEREAVFVVLERYGLARRTRGGAPLTSPEAEGIS